MVSFKTLLGLPYFLATVFFFFWSVPIGCLIYAIRFASAGLRNDIHEWTLMMNRVMGVKLVKLGQHSLHKDSRCVYLSNHRSWADFFIDVHLTEGMAAPMSRAMVFFAFPVFMTTVWILNGVIIFKRGHIADKKSFNSWMDKQLNAPPSHNLLVYPEGHRSTKPTSLPLKRGMLHYAHGRGLPVQIIMTRGKELVLSEKRLRASYGCTLVVSFSRVIESKGKEDFEEFWGEVQNVWDEVWSEVYSADASALPPLTQPSVPKFDYPLSMRLAMFSVTLVSMTLLLLLLLGMAMASRALLGLMPAAMQVPVVLGLILTLLASFISTLATDPKAKAA